MKMEYVSAYADSEGHICASWVDSPHFGSAWFHTGEKVIAPHKVLILLSEEERAEYLEARRQQGDKLKSVRCAIAGPVARITPAV
jgi:hypothetical protein